MSSSSKISSYDINDISSASQRDSPIIEIATKVSPNTKKLLLTPISLGQLKISPKEYLSPQLNSTRKVISDGRPSVFSPLVRNRGISALSSKVSSSTKNLGSTTPSHFFKQLELKHSPSQNSPLLQKDSRPCSVAQNIKETGSYQHIKMPHRQDESIRGSFQLPSISTSNKNLSQKVYQVKSSLTHLEEKPSFFNELNKYARKSGQAPSVNSLQTESTASNMSIDEINLNRIQQSSPSVPSPSKITQPNQFHFPSTFKRSSLGVSSQASAALDEFRNLSITSQSFQDLHNLSSQPAQQQVPPSHKSSFGSERGSQSNKNSQEEDQGTFTSFNAALTREARKNLPLQQKRSKFNQVHEIKVNNNQFLSLQNSPSFANFEEQKSQQFIENPTQTKDSGEEYSAQSESSEGDQTPNEFKNKNIQKATFRSRKMDPSKYFSPQLTSSSQFRRLNKQDNQNGNSQNQSILKQLSMMQGKTEDPQSNKEEQLEIVQKQEQQAGLLRELQYLSNEMKKYVIERVDKAESLKQSIFKFCMIHDLQEFSFYFGQFLDHVFEERVLAEATSSLKMPVSLFSQIEALMNQFLDEQQKSSDLKDLFRQQLTKHNYLISPSTLLEQLGGYRKLSNLSQQFASILLSSTLSNYLASCQESQAAEKIQEFLIAALQGDPYKVTQLIESLKKMTQASPTQTEYFVLKKLLFQFFQKRPYFSKEVRDSFLELLETYRYFFTSEYGFNSKQLLEIRPAIIKQILFLWKTEPFLSTLHESSKGSLFVFVEELFLFIFSQRNCYELRSSFNTAFSGQKFDSDVVEALKQLIQTTVRKQNIKQNVIVKNIEYSFDKLTWLVSTDNNLVDIIGDYQEIQQAMIGVISQQMSALKTPAVSEVTSQQQSNQVDSIASQRNQVDAQDGSIQEQQPLHSVKFQRLKDQKTCNLLNESIMNDVNNFSEFIGMYFNYRTTYHYTDLLCFFASEKNTFEVFVYWASVIAESVMEVRGISQEQSDLIKDYITDLFNLNNRQ